MTQQQGSTFQVSIVLSHGQDIASVPDPDQLRSQGDAVCQRQQWRISGQGRAECRALCIAMIPQPASCRSQRSALRVRLAFQEMGQSLTLMFTAKAKGTGTISIAVPGARNSHNQPLDVLGSQATVTVN